MRKHRWKIAASLLVLLAAAGFVAWWLAPLAEVDDGDYPMQAVSVFTEDARSDVRDLARGRYALWNRGPGIDHLSSHKDRTWETVPCPEVKAYPALRSSRPLFGVVDFNSWPEPGKKRPWYFVIDESRGTGAGYDRLYFDLDRDLDLTNNAALVPLADPPRPSHKWNDWGSTNICFAMLRVPTDFGLGHGIADVEILPRLAIDDKCVSMYFVTTEAHAGTIQIGRWRYRAVLSRSTISERTYDAGGRINLSTTGFWPGSVSQEWWGDDSLASLRLANGKFYALSTTPAGETLKVRRYRGDLGILRFGEGSRKVTEAVMCGSLRNKTTIVPVGKFSRAAGPLERVTECSLPVGDYYPQQMRFRYGDLAFWLSDNYHAEGKSHGAPWPRKSTVSIRKDRPLLLDFSARPEVMFVSPAKNQTVKPGDEVAVQAVLVDPALRAMIRGLNDTSRKGSPSLEPTVTITDASGRAVAQGLMPFG